MSIHNPDPCTLDCPVCGDRWPCETRRLEYISEVNGRLLALRARMTEEFVAAATGPLWHWPAGDLADRYLGWLVDLPTRAHVEAGRPHAAYAPAGREDWR